MKKLSFYYKRSKSISIQEMLVYRIKQFLVNNLFLRLYVGKTFSKDNKKINTPHFFNEYWNNINFPEFDYNYFIFNNVKIDISKSIEWNKNPLDKTEIPEKYFALYNKQNYKQFGDIKYIFDISRFHFLPYIALSRKDQSIKLITQHLVEFRNNSKYLKSIYWTSGIEVAVRTINLIFTYLILTHCKASETIAKKEASNIIIEEIEKGIFFIKNNLSLYSSSNNHLLAELAALTIYYSLTCKSNKYLRLFLSQIKRQFNSDGVNFELSTRYHAETLDYIISVIVISKKMGYNIPIDLKEKLKKSFDFLFHCQSYNVDVNFGDCDDGHLIFPFFSKNFNYYKSILQSSDLLLGTSFSSEAIDDRNKLIFGDKERPKTLNMTPRNSIFKESGYAFLYDNNEKVKVTFDFGNLGDNLMSAHGHSDLLSFTFSKQGIPIIVDTGTYQYHTKFIQWRNYFRSIQAHNTISVDNENHAKHLTRMSWSKTVKPKLINYKETMSTAVVEAKCLSFYENMGVTHKRKISLDKQKRLLAIEDELINISQKNHSITSYLHFHPTINIERETDMLILYNDKIKTAKVEIPDINKSKIFRGFTSPILGWYSSHFDKKTPCSTLVQDFTLKKQMHLLTTISY